LVTAAEREGALQKRSTPKQIEYWADLGRAVERIIDLSDVFAVLQGMKRLRLEDVESQAVDSDEVFGDLQQKADAGRLSHAVTSAAFYFEASKKQTGMLDRVEVATGRRQTGQFRNGEFHPSPA
jgi:hypothetical protein